MWKSPRIIMRFAISVGHGFAKNLREYPVTLAMSVFLNLLIEESYLIFLVAWILNSSRAMRPVIFPKSSMNAEANGQQSSLLN